MPESLLASPVFLVGAERSGTTLLRLMLDSHPSILFLGEFEYAVDLMNSDAGWPDLEAYYAFLAVDRVFSRYRLGVDRSLGYPELIQSFLRQIVERTPPGIQAVGATVHRNFHQLLRIWPHARFIHLVRDVRDVARSCIEMGWAGNMFVAADRWVEAELRWQELSRILPPDRRLDLTYEGLIEDPVAELTRLCAFLQVPYDPAMLEYPSRTTYQAPDRRLIGQWKTRLDPDEIRLAEARVGNMLEERGYTRSDLPAIHVTPAVERGLRRRDRWSRIGFRMKRYGALLLISDALTRRLGLKNMQGRVRRMLNAIDNRYLK